MSASQTTGPIRFARRRRSRATAGTEALSLRKVDVTATPATIGGVTRVLPALALLALVTLPAGCGHQAPVREGGRVTLIEEAPASQSFVIERAAIEGALEQGAGAFIRQVRVRPVATADGLFYGCLLYTSPSPRDKRQSRMPSSA